MTLNKEIGLDAVGLVIVIFLYRMINEKRKNE